MWSAPTVAGLIEPQRNLVSSQVDDVGGAGAVDVGEMNPLLVKLVWIIKYGRVIHRNLRAEAAIAQGWPVTHFCISDPYDVCEPIARKIRQINGLRAISEDQCRAFVFVKCFTDGFRWAEAFLRLRRVPSEDFILRDQNVCVAVPVEIYGF